LSERPTPATRHLKIVIENHADGDVALDAIGDGARNPADAGAPYSSSIQTGQWSEGLSSRQ